MDNVDRSISTSYTNTGTDTDVFYFGDEDITIELNLWALSFDKPIRPRSIRSGVFRANNFEIQVNTVLFDTGALHRSYINKALVDKNRITWNNNIVQRKSNIRLGDQKTIVTSDEEIQGIVGFTNIQGDIVESNISLVVHNMPGMDIIIGLPDINSSFLNILTEMLAAPSSTKVDFDSATISGLQAMEHALDYIPSKLASSADVNDELIPTSYADSILQEASIKLDNTLTFNLSNHIDTVPDGYYVWSSAVDENSEEELATEDPCSHSVFLNFVATAHTDAVKSYMDMLESHIGPMLRESGEIRRIMTSPLALDVFVPKEWKGIQKVPPIQLEFDSTFPATHKIKSRPINPRLYDNVKEEINRMMGYMYVQSTSPWASPLVVAPKATAPFIRMCGDYRWLNNHIVLPQAYIPNVQKEILKAAGFKYKIDLDLTNSFHQMIISEDTSLKLAVQTPWGLLRPLYMPEGVSPASGYLQSIMMDIFAECESWTIVIFDNLLVLANTVKDAEEKLVKILTICRDRGVVLKLAKSWIGFESVKFFGYRIWHNTYEMDEDRKKAITEFTMPKSTKEMQRFLGSALFFKSFIVNFSEKCHLLHGMIKKDFNWDTKTWKLDYVTAFENLKKELANSISIHFPNYSLRWTLRVDASDNAVGAILFQTREDSEGKSVMEPIGVGSKKFTEVATRWDPYKKEAYAAYYGVHYFSYYLRGKPIILETDHRNLLWIEKSEVPIVIRWRVYLQSFTIWLRHISGPKNVVADWLSRMNNMMESDRLFEFIDQQYTDVSLILNSLTEETYDPNNLNALQIQKEEVTSNEGIEIKLTPEEMIQRVHGGKNLHKGALRTWNALNKFFGGHGISFKFIEEWIATCPVCQKDRLAMVNTLKPIVRHIKPPHQRSRIGVDRLTVTPADKDGNTTLIVVVEHFTKFVAVYVSKEYTGESIARALLQFFSAYGIFEELMSDPGSDIMSSAVICLNKWMGIAHIVSLVDRHESNGVEQTNNQILRHLKTLVHDYRLVNKWSDPTILSLIIFTLNDSINSETGCRAFDLKFGSQDGPYLKLPDLQPSPEFSQKWLNLLNDDLKVIREISTKFQADLIATRLAQTPEEKQNKFQPGDLVLFQLNPDKPKPTKLTSPYLGPYEVLRQVKNDVEVRHVSLGVVKQFHVTRLKLFAGSMEDAKKIALWDADQFVIKRILAWKGDPQTRTTMEFKVMFEDGDIIWLPYSKDLDDSIPYGDYVMSVPMLYFLKFRVKDVARETSSFKNKVIDNINIGDKFYMDIRYYTLEWYDGLPMQDKYDKIYVVECVYDRFVSKKHMEVYVRVPVFNEVLTKWPSLYVTLYGGYTKFTPDMVLVNNTLVKRYPELAPSP